MPSLKKMRLSLIQSIIFCLLSAFASLSLYVETLAGVADDVASCVVALRQNPQEAEKSKTVGSGFLVRKDSKVFLVTASHVARGMGDKWKLIVQGPDGKRAVARMQNTKWNISRTADVAVTHLNGSQEQKQFLMARAISHKLLKGQSLPPSRDVPLTVMGYPIGLESTGYIPPLSLKTKAASGFITLRRFDTQEQALFLILQDPAVAGLNGGPVFDTGESYFSEGSKMIVREGLKVVGIIHGLIKDKTGGKLTAVVPSSEIVPIIDTFAAFQ